MADQDHPMQDAVAQMWDPNPPAQPAVQGPEAAAAPEALNQQAQDAPPQQQQQQQDQQPLQNPAQNAEANPAQNAGANPAGATPAVPVGQQQQGQPQQPQQPQQARQPAVGGPLPAHQSLRNPLYVGPDPARQQRLTVEEELAELRAAITRATAQITTLTAANAGRPAATYAQRVAGTPRATATAGARQQPHQAAGPSRGAGPSAQPSQAARDAPRQPQPASPEDELAARLGAMILNPTAMREAVAQQPDSPFAPEPLPELFALLMTARATGADAIMTPVRHTVAPVAHVLNYLLEVLETYDRGMMAEAQANAPADTATDMEIADEPADAYAMTRNRPTLKVNKPQVFSGRDKEDVDLFLDEQERFQRLTHVPAHLQVDVACGFLRGDAQLLWSAQERLARDAGTVVDWQYFKQILISFYRPINPEDAARARLHNIRQTGTVNDYTLRFNSELARIRTMPVSEGDRVYLYLRGLRPELRARVAVNPTTRTPWESLQEVQQYTLNTAAHDLPSMNAELRERNAKRPAEKPAQRVPSNGGGAGKNARAKGNKKPRLEDLEPESKAYRQMHFRGGLCFRCHEQGHKAEDCPLNGGKGGGGGSGPKKPPGSGGGGKWSKGPGKPK